MRTTILLLAFSLVTAACDDEAPAETPTTDESDEASAESNEGAETEPSEPSPTRMLMREHFTEVREARAALIGDDIEAVRVAMRWLGEHNPGADEVPEPLRPGLERRRC
ncbi:MAG: hypothetical protein ACI9KE_005758 [Polyangiales bacterium]|jgi:hypothetical protein